MLVGFALAGLTVACSTSSVTGTGGQSTGCNTDPFACAPGETCWPKDYAPTFACLKSVAEKKVQDPCANTPGQVTCGDNQACVEFEVGMGGCLSYCSDALHPCPGVQACVEIKVGTKSDAPAIRVCAPPQLDAGQPVDDVDASMDAKPIDAHTDRPN